MRIEIFLVLLAAGCIFHVYTEGKYVKVLYRWKKYYQIGGIVLGTLFLYYMMKKNPMNTQELLNSSSEYIKYLPIDKQTTSMLSPILDFTAKQNLYSSGGGGGGQHPVVSMNHTPPLQYQPASERMMHSGKKATKRSVSETKKKFVASRQNWCCGDCNNQLTAWFEVDHKIRLEYGGSNHIDNLVALCRECHGKKTTIENL